MDENKHKQFFDYIKPKREEIQADLLNLPIATFRRVGDFGCGWGFTTWCLMQEIPNAECIGVDKFDPNDPPPEFPNDFSYEKTKNFYKEIDAEKYPDFQQHDIVIDENLPSNFNFVYCKRVLYNIFMSSDGDNKLNCAINNIARALIPNGWLCLVEIEAQTFQSMLEKSLINANFEFETPRRISRPYLTCFENYNNYPYLIYQCKQKKNI